MWFWLLVGSLMPIWRSAAAPDKGLSIWKFLAVEIKPKKHLAVGEALERARQAGYIH